MHQAFWILLVLTCLIVFSGALEVILHRRHLDRIPVRIHVNGTRGKSSVTRLVAAGLREGGIRTCAKTTGTLPRMILPDGSEYALYRPSTPNIIEQLRIVRIAAGCRADALVLECMALQPQLQWLSESRLVRATHAVITNARADHLDVMGPTETDVAMALAGMVPPSGRLYTTERRHIKVFRTAAQDRGCTLVELDPEEHAGVGAVEMRGFSYIEHTENVALALRVCLDLGVDRETALRGMWKAAPDPGVMTVDDLQVSGRRIHFVNGFAANDPESTERIWSMALRRYAEADKRIAIFNCRADRPERSRQLGEACTRWSPADHYVLIGSSTHIFARAASRAGLDHSRLVFAEHQSVEHVFKSVMSLVRSSALVMGMGNIGGPGLDVVRFFHKRSVTREPA